jgi:hypothetical protein
VKTGMKHSRLTVILPGLLLAGTAHAFDFGGLSDPFGWIGGNDYYDNYDRPYGGYGYGNPGYGGYGYGSPGYGGYGYGDPGYGGYGGYGSPGYGGYGYGAPGYGGYGSGYSGDGEPASALPPGAQAAEIERLKARIRKLEQAVQQAPSTFSNTTGNTLPAFKGQMEHQWPAPPAAPPVVAQPPAGQSANPVYQPNYGILPRYRFQ